MRASVRCCFSINYSCDAAIHQNAIHYTCCAAQTFPIVVLRTHQRRLGHKADSLLAPVLPCDSPANLTRGLTHSAALEFQLLLRKTVRGPLTRANNKAFSLPRLTPGLTMRSVSLASSLLYTRRSGHRAAYGGRGRGGHIYGLPSGHLARAV